MSPGATPTRSTSHATSAPGRSRRRVIRASSRNGSAARRWPRRRRSSRARSRMWVSDPWSPTRRDGDTSACSATSISGTAKNTFAGATSGCASRPRSTLASSPCAASSSSTSRPTGNPRERPIVRARSSRPTSTSSLTATSTDGTKVPYFVVMREGTKLDGSNPTVLYGYGGFEIPMTPNYNATMGSSWLERGGVWVLANIRGGGEFGPEWHTTALREGRRKTHDDFAAVAEDIIKRGITSPKHLGIMGGSQGGLLVGATFTQHPELFKAVVCQVPLLDMRRYNKLLAGASWMGGYGNPDEPKDWGFISTYSPYQNVFKEKKDPRVLFVTSTRYDRVHPGHARKMVAKMREQGHDVLYYENTEGGHAAAVTPAQQANIWALTYTFLLNELR